MAKELSEKQSKPKALLCLLGITMVYQVSYQLVVVTKLPDHKEYEMKPPCWASHIEEKQAGASTSQVQCSENALFKRWRELDSEHDRPSASLEDPNDKDLEILAVDPGGRIEKKWEHVAIVGIDGSVANNSLSSTLLGSSISSTSASSIRVDSSIVDAPDSPVDIQQTSNVSQPSFATGNAIFNEDLSKSAEESSTKTPITNWGASLVQLQNRLEDELSYIRSKRLRGSIRFATKDRSLLEKIKDLHRELCMDPRRQMLDSCVQFRPLPQTSSAWIASLETSRQKIESRVKAIQERRALKGRLTAKSNSSSSTIKGKLEELNVKLLDIKKQREVWETALNQEAMVLGREMCNAPERKKYDSCAIFLRSHQKETAVVPRSDALRVLRLPEYIKDAAKTIGSIGAPRVVKKQDLSGVQWSGRIPKVACIMAIPNNTRAFTRLKYVVNNFRAQTYEGPRQLVLTYHYKNEHVARLAKQFADGTYIKAVASRATDDTTTLRYGAWASDEDATVLAHWDFNSWHHPQRLQMQVRALGFTGRPVSILKQWTEGSEGGERIVASAKVGSGTSFVGERQWMEQHWHPFIPQYEASLAASLGFVAQLEMPELFITHK